MFRSVTYWGLILKVRARHSHGQRHSIFPGDTSLDSKELHKEIHLRAPLVRTYARAMVGGLRVSFALGELGSEQVQVRLCIRLPELVGKLV